MTTDWIDLLEGGDSTALTGFLAGRGPGLARRVWLDACRLGRADALPLLIRHLPHRGDPSIGAPVAARHGHIECVRFLTKQGAGSGTWLGRTTAGEAATRGDLAILRLLRSPRDFRPSDWSRVEQGPREDRRTPGALDGYGALINAVRANQAEAVQFILGARVDPNLPTRRGRTCLELARELGHEQVEAVLIRMRGKPIDAANATLFQAAQWGRVDIAQARLPDSDRKMKWRAFEAASGSGAVEVLHLLAPHRPRDLAHALTLAAEGGHLEAVRMLLALGADPDALRRADIGRGTEGRALQYAAAWGHTPVLSTLIEAGAKVDKRGRFLRIGNASPLHTAVAQGQVDAAKLLIRAGCDVNLLSSDRVTAKQLAEERPDFDVLVPLLEGAGAGGRKVVVAARKALRAKLKKHKRQAVTPVVEPGDGEPTDSKYGGEPLLTPDHGRPTGRDDEPLPLLVQVDLRTHPDKTCRCDALLQVFHHPEASVVRRIPLDPCPTHVPDGGPQLPAQRITGWSRTQTDLPALAQDCPSIPELDEVEEAMMRQLCLAGDKLGGWPYWLQDIEIPIVDGDPLDTLLLQITGGLHTPVTFGDGGIGYVFTAAGGGPLRFHTQCY